MPFAEIQPPDIIVLDQFVGLAAAEDLAFGHYVGAVGDAEGFADVVVGEKRADSPALSRGVATQKPIFISNPFSF